MKIKALLEPKRIICFTFCVVFVMSIFIYYQKWSTIGFPDGNKTELDKINEKLYLVYLIISFVFALFFLFFGLNQKENNPKKDKILQIGISVAIVFFVGIMITNYFLAMNLK